MSTVKLKDVAQALGVSVVTVSNALSGKKGVSSELREQVVAKAREMGYNVSRYTKKSAEETKIGVVVSRKYLEVGASFYWAMYQQVAYVASKKNCFTMLAILDSAVTSKSALPAIVREESLAGMLVIGKIERIQMEHLMSVTKVPVVLLDFHEYGLACDAVMSNNYMGMYRATSYLLERGHDNIAFVGSRGATDNIMERYFGFRKAMEEWNKPIRKEWVLEDRDIESGIMKVTLPDRIPTAFACNSDHAASFVYDELLRRGYRVPEDVSLVAYDNYLFGHPLGKTITTYNVDMYGMAKAAIDILLKKQKNPDKRNGIQYIDSHIVERESVKNLNAFGRLRKNTETRRI